MIKQYERLIKQYEIGTGVTDAQIARVRCGGYHSGNHRIVLTGDRRSGECQGCAQFFSAAEINGAKPGDLGRGGVILD